MAVDSASIPQCRLQSGALVPTILGSDTAAAEDAIDIGYRHIDRAPVSGLEARVAALAAAFRGSLQSKNDKHPESVVIPLCRQSPADWRLDIYLVHCPFPELQS
jgi:diketogulonate reductase-like aldo/keto reductase